MRVPLGLAFNQCGGSVTTEDPVPATPNSTHALPYPDPSCTPPTLKSTTLTMGTTGAGQGSVRFDTVCIGGAFGEVPPCNTTPGEQEDIRIAISITDVRCAVAFGSVCLNPNADYTGSLTMQSDFRLTDHSSGSPPTPCSNNAGNTPCVTATVVDLPFFVPIGPCAVTGTPNGSTCTVNTTMDGVNPGTVKELQRAWYGFRNVRVFDSGPDALTNTGDETKFLEQGVFGP